MSPGLATVQFFFFIVGKIGNKAAVLPVGNWKDTCKNVFYSFMCQLYKAAH